VNRTCGEEQTPPTRAVHGRLPELTSTSMALRTCQIPVDIVCGLTVHVVALLACWFALARFSPIPLVRGREFAALRGLQGLPEPRPEPGPEPAPRSGPFFDLAERPKGAQFTVSYGERAVPHDMPANGKANPWWKSVEAWKNGSVTRSKRQKMVFVTGLPHSGTTLMELFLRQFDGELSTLSFAKTDHKHEGRDLIPHKQYPLPEYGGAFGGYGSMCGNEGGKYLQKGLRQNEASSSAVQKQMQVLTWKYWQPHFELSKPGLVEKDPRHLLRMRMWQNMFRDTHDVFPIFTLMHPLESITYASCRPVENTRTRMVRNWLNCHRALLEDLKHLRNYLVVHYEAWFLYPDDTAQAIETYLNLEGRVNMTFDARRLHAHGNAFALKDKYFGRCSNVVRNFSKSEAAKDWPSRLYEDELATYGYDLYNTTTIHKPSAFGLCQLDGVPCP